MRDTWQGLLLAGSKFAGLGSMQLLVKILAGSEEVLAMGCMCHGILASRHLK